MAFDSREYQFSDITCVVAGNVPDGFRGLKYKESQEKEPMYAKGKEPHSIQAGNKKYEGTLKMTQSAYNALVEAGDGSILDLETDIIIAYGNPANGDAVKTDKLRKVQFTEAEDGMDQGDKFAEISLPIIFLRLEKNAV